LVVKLLKKGDKMKKISLILASIMAFPLVAEDYGMMGSYSWGLLGLVYFVLATLIFSIIFWLTHNWLVKGKKK